MSVASDVPFGGRLLGRAAIPGALISETVHPPGSRLARHAHARASFCLVTRGDFRESSAAGACEYGAGDVIFRPEEEWHSDFFLESGARCFNVELDRSLMGRIPAAAREPSASRVVRRLLRQLRRELRETSDCPLVAEGLLYQILGEAFERKPADRSGAWLPVLDRVLRERFTQRLTVVELAKEIGIHPVHLARAFRKSRGVTVAESVRSLRISYAIELLGDRRASLAEIALATGFADQSHFTKTFKRCVGASPGEYRRRQE